MHFFYPYWLMWSLGEWLVTNPSVSKMQKIPFCVKRPAKANTMLQQAGLNPLCIFQSVSFFLPSVKIACFVWLFLRFNSILQEETQAGNFVLRSLTTFEDNQQVENLLVMMSVAVCDWSVCGQWLKQQQPRLFSAAKMNKCTLNITCS